MMGFTTLSRTGVIGFPERLDVLVATKNGTEPQGLEYLPVPEHDVLLSTRPGWGLAANEVLDAADTDSLFVDDDIEFTPHTFDLLARYWDRADVFGFTLLTRVNGPIEIASAGYYIGHHGALLPQLGPETLLPAYMAHVTASCMVIKHHVLAAGIRFPLWPGMHSEDVAFTLDCWLHGFKVAYLPGVCWHHMGATGIGATLAKDEEADKKIAINKMLLNEWMSDHHIGQALADGVIPFGAVLL